MIRVILLTLTTTLLLALAAATDAQEAPCATKQATLVSQVGYTMTLTQTDGKSRTVWPGVDVGAQWSHAWSWETPHELWRGGQSHRWSMTQPVLTLTSGHPFTAHVCVWPATPFDARATPTPGPWIAAPGYEPPPQPYPAPVSDVGKAPDAPFVTAAWLSTTVAEVSYAGGCLRLSDVYRLGCTGGTVRLGTGGGDAGYTVNGGEVFVVRDTGGVEVARATLGYPRRVWGPLILK